MNGELKCQEMISPSIPMVDSVAATIDAVIANGGKIVQPLGVDAPEITARFSDPAGNIFGLYQQPAREN